MLDQSKLCCGSGAKANNCRCLVGVPAAAKRARILSQLLPRFTEQRQACSRSFVPSWRHWCKGRITTCRCMVGVPEAERRALTLSTPWPRSTEQPQACSIKDSIEVASSAKANTCRCLVGVPEPKRRARTLTAPPPHTVEQRQACSIRISFEVASVQRQSPLSPAGAWSECRRRRDEHAPCLRFHLAPWSSRTLARSVVASWRPRRCKGTHMQVPGRSASDTETSM